MNLLSDPHSPLPLYRCAFDPHSELLRSNKADMLVSVVHSACVFLFYLDVSQPMQMTVSRGIKQHVNVCFLLNTDTSPLVNSLYPSPTG